MGLGLDGAAGICRDSPAVCCWISPTHWPGQSSLTFSLCFCSAGHVHTMLSSYKNRLVCNAGDRNMMQSSGTSIKLYFFSYLLHNQSHRADWHWSRTSLQTQAGVQIQELSNNSWSRSLFSASWQQPNTAGELQSCRETGRFYTTLREENNILISWFYWDGSSVFISPSDVPSCFRGDI